MAGDDENLRRFYEFGPFRLDPQRLRLVRDGEVVPLPPKALETLLVMVRNPGKVLERETLMQAVWCRACVEDANLTVAISHLRKALGQHGETADYVATVARVGYRFLADVREVREEPPPAFANGPISTGPPIGDDGPPSPAVIEEASPSEPAIRRPRALALAALGLVAVVVAGLWAFRGTNHTETTAARPRSIAAGHFDRAIALERDMKWTEAEQAFTRAIALDPNNANAHYWRAVTARIVGKTDDYLASMETARRLAPLAKPIARDYYEVVLRKEGCALGLAYLEAFHATYDTAALERQELSAFHDALCARYEHAIATLGRTPLNELSDKTKAFLAVAYAKTGRRQQTLDILEYFSRTHARIYLTSYVHVALGDVDAAFAALENGIDAGDGAGRRLKYDELLAPLRSDARFLQLLRRMNLPE